MDGKCIAKPTAAEGIIDERRMFVADGRKDNVIRCEKVHELPNCGSKIFLLQTTNTARYCIFANPNGIFLNQAAMNKPNFLLILLIVLGNALFAQQPGFRWARQVGGLNDDAGVKVAVDGNGNVYTVGTFRNTVDFDPGPGSASMSSSGNQDVFILKTDSMGNFIWAGKIGGPYSEYVNAIVMDEQGFFYLTGFFSGSVDFDAGAGSFLLSSTGVADNDAYVAKYDTAGQFVWAKRIGGTLNDYGYGLSIDGNQHLLITGSFRGAVDFDPNAGISNLTSFGDYDVFIAQWDTAGNANWTRQSGGPGIDHGFSIATDQVGNVYTTGVFAGTGDFDPGTNVFAMTVAGSASDQDVFLSKLDPNGNFIWAKRFGGLNYDNAASIAVDSQGVYTTGYFWGTVDFDPGIGVSNQTAAGADDIFISKLDTAGNFKWARRAGSTGFNAGSSVVLDSLGAVYCSGYFNGTTDFDPGTGAYPMSSAGSTDVFMLKLDSDGNFKWARSVGGNGADEGNLYRDKSGSIYVAGDFSGTADLNPASGVNAFTSNGNADAFILKLSTCQPTTATQSVTACDAYLYNSTYLALSATYLFTYQSVNGCDSTIILDLTINHSTVSVFTQLACDSFSIAGITYTASGYYPQQTFTNSVGCDSTVMIHLVVQYSNGSTTAQTACDTYTWNSQTYTQSGTYTQTFMNTSGCDSIAALNLDLHYATGSTVNATACDSYYLNGNTYTGSGTYTQSFTNAAGCDSTLSLQLTLNQSNAATLNDTACVAYLLNGQTYTVGGSYTQNFTNAGGCDSVLTLNLLIPVVNTAVTQSGVNLSANMAGAVYQWVLCPAYTPIAGASNQTYTALANADYAVIVTQYGCSDTSACYTVSSVGYHTPDLQTGILLYPNPVRNQLSIRHAMAGQIIRAELTNVMGQTLLQFHLNDPVNTLDLSPLPAGVYTLQLFVNDERRQYKVVKQ